MMTRAFMWALDIADEVAGRVPHTSRLRALWRAVTRQQVDQGD